MNLYPPPVPNAYKLCMDAPTIAPWWLEALELSEDSQVKENWPQKTRLQNFLTPGLQAPSSRTIFLFFGGGIDEGRYEFFESPCCWLELTRVRNSVHHRRNKEKPRGFADRRASYAPFSWFWLPYICIQLLRLPDGVFLEARRRTVTRTTRRGNSPNPPSARLWRNVKNAAGGSKTKTDVYSTCGPNISVRHAQRGDAVNDGS